MHLDASLGPIITREKLNDTNISIFFPNKFNNKLKVRNTSTSKKEKDGRIKELK